eukprot:Gb_06458 [translate_table: standard]
MATILHIITAHAAAQLHRPLPSTYSSTLPSKWDLKGGRRHLFAGVKNRSLDDRHVILKKKLIVKCKAMRDGTQGTGGEVYQGVYGPWSIEASDNREVILYRAGLVTSALSFVVAASTAFLPDESLVKVLIQQNLDMLYALGAGGLGLSLVLIHIYVTPIKRTLQILWALGMLGSLVTSLSLAQPTGEGLAQYVIENPVAVWFVGPLFAALTGLVFKEGLCYGKLEAAGLTFVIPTLLLGHLTGLMDDQLKLGLLGLWMVLFTVFAARKFTQPIKDDIGDKSVFMFNALPEEEKATFLRKREEKTPQSITRD